MSAAANWLARWVWVGLLLFMRWPWVKRARRAWMNRVPLHVRQRMIRQDRFARHHGQKLIGFSFSLLLGSFAVSGCYFATLWLVQTGIIFHPVLSR